MRIITDMFAWPNANVPDWNTISISGYHMREAGSTAVQEVAFTLGDGMAYVQAAIDAGWTSTSLRPGYRSSSMRTAISWRKSPSSGRRAGCGRALCARHFGAKNPKSWMLRFHTQTAGSTLTAQQPENNIVRTAHAGAGGCAGRDAIAAYEFFRRSAGAAHGTVGAHRVAHPADHRIRIRRARRRSIRWPGRTTSKR